jgi:hypothetical protein
VARIQADRITATPVASHHRLQVDYTQDGTSYALPRNLFLKLANPEFPHNSEHETIFYQRLIPLMQRAEWPAGFPFARCLDAAWSPELKLSHLLLEDLTETHFTVDQPMPPSQAAAERLIDAYAAFHAFWWEHPSLGVDTWPSTGRQTSAPNWKSRCFGAIISGWVSKVWLVTPGRIVSTTTAPQSCASSV